MNATVKLVKQLMAFRPVSADQPNVNACVEFLRDYLARHKVYTRIEKLKRRAILYAATRRIKAPSILFNAHLDVVPADEKNFRFRERSGWIWGRGSGDCLGNCAVLAQVLIQCRGQADAGAIFSTDEEIGGHTTRVMVDKGFRGKVVIIMDGGGYRMGVAQKGILTLKLTASGKACHGSAPWLGKNALDRLIGGYLKVKKIFPPVKKGDEWHTTCSANVMSAGTVFNRVPDRAELILDIRHTGNTSARKLVRKIRTVSGLKAEVLAQCPVVHCDERSVILRELRKFMETSLKHRIDTVRMNGATDARHFTVLNVPIVMIGIPGKNAHADNERANIKGMLAYQAMLENLCKHSLPSL
ncbi:M20 family metallopeptidase [Verrucomicrobiota bacterium]